MKMFVESPNRQKEMAHIVDRAQGRFDLASEVRRFAQQPLRGGRGIRHLQSGVPLRSCNLSKVDPLSKIPLGDQVEIPLQRQQGAGQLKRKLFPLPNRKQGITTEQAEQAAHQRIYHPKQTHPPVARVGKIQQDHEERRDDQGKESVAKRADGERDECQKRDERKSIRSSWM